MMCYPIVLLAGLLTVVRAQGQSVARIFISYSYSSFPIMAQLCLTFAFHRSALYPVFHSGGVSVLYAGNLRRSLRRSFYCSCVKIVKARFCALSIRVVVYQFASR